MRLVVVSDTHGFHDQIGSLPVGDVFVHAGDFMNSGLYREEVLSFNRWLARLPIESWVACAGNHDRLFQLTRRQAREALSETIYIENTGVTINSVRIELL